MTHLFLGLTALTDIFQATQTMIKQFFASLNLNPHSLSAPISIAEVVYGSLDIGWLPKPVVPGFMLLYVFFILAIGTSILIVSEKKSTLTERIRVCGVNQLEFLAAHFLTQLLFVFGQGMPLFAYLMWVEKFPSAGSYGTVYLIYLSQGVAGIFYGLTVSSLFSDHVSTAFLFLGSMVAMLFLSGIVWPFEFIPVAFQWLGMLLFPMPLSLRALKFVMFKGFTLTRAPVLLGFAATGGWILFCAAVILLVIRKQVAN